LIQKTGTLVAIYLGHSEEQAAKLQTKLIPWSHKKPAIR
jgi:hypothetical protein